MCYARSKDGGVTWEKSTGEPYKLPIRAGNAEYARKIPQDSELINQTSMASTEDDHPVIATYWREPETTVPQYFLIWHDGLQWNYEQASERTQPFTLKGGGTKKIPISRPMLFVGGDLKHMLPLLIYRDNENGRILTMTTRDEEGIWRHKKSFPPVTDSSWEPSGEGEISLKNITIRLFIQDVGQGDGEKVVDKKPTYAILLTFLL